MSEQISKEAMEAAAKVVDTAYMSETVCNEDVVAKIIQSAIDTNESAQWRPVAEFPTQNGFFKRYMVCSPFGTMGFATFDSANKKWMFDGRNVCFWREMPALPKGFH
jgi:hypothetical protein